MENINNTTYRVITFCSNNETLRRKSVELHNNTNRKHRSVTHKDQFNGRKREEGDTNTDLILHLEGDNGAYKIVTSPSRHHSKVNKQDVTNDKKRLNRCSQFTEKSKLNITKETDHIVSKNQSEIVPQHNKKRITHTREIHSPDKIIRKEPEPDFVIVGDNSQKPKKIKTRNRKVSIEDSLQFLEKTKNRKTKDPSKTEFTHINEKYTQNLSINKALLANTKNIETRHETPKKDASTQKKASTENSLHFLKKNEIVKTKNPSKALCLLDTDINSQNLSMNDAFLADTEENCKTEHETSKEETKVQQPNKNACDVFKKVNDLPMTCSEPKQTSHQQMQRRTRRTRLSKMPLKQPVKRNISLPKITILDKLARKMPSQVESSSVSKTNVKSKISTCKQESKHQPNDETQVLFSRAPSKNIILGQYNSSPNSLKHRRSSNLSNRLNPMEYLKCSTYYGDQLLPNMQEHVKTSKSAEQNGHRNSRLRSKTKKIKHIRGKRREPQTIHKIDPLCKTVSVPNACVDLLKSDSPCELRTIYKSPSACNDEDDDDDVKVRPKCESTKCKCKRPESRIIVTIRSCLICIVMICWLPCFLILFLCWLITYPMRPHECKNEVRKSLLKKIVEWCKTAKWYNLSFLDAFWSMLHDTCNCYGLNNTTSQRPETLNAIIERKISNRKVNESKRAIVSPCQTSKQIKNLVQTKGSKKGPPKFPNKNRLYSLGFSANRGWVVKPLKDGEHLCTKSEYLKEQRMPLPTQYKEHTCDPDHCFNGPIAYRKSLKEQSMPLPTQYKEHICDPDHCFNGPIAYKTAWPTVECKCLEKPLECKCPKPPIQKIQSPVNNKGEMLETFTKSVKKVNAQSYSNPPIHEIQSPDMYNKGEMLETFTKSVKKVNAQSYSSPPIQEIQSPDIIFKGPEAPSKDPSRHATKKKYSRVHRVGERHTCLCPKPSINSRKGSRWSKGEMLETLTKSVKKVNAQSYSNPPIQEIKSPDILLKGPEAPKKGTSRHPTKKNYTKIHRVAERHTCLCPKPTISSRKLGSLDDLVSHSKKKKSRKGEMLETLKKYVKKVNAQSYSQQDPHFCENLLKGSPQVGPRPRDQIGSFCANCCHFCLLVLSACIWLPLMCCCYLCFKLIKCCTC